MKKDNGKLPILPIVVGAVVLVIIAVIIIVVKLNSGYRLIKVESYTGEVELERKAKATEMFEGMNLKSEDTVTTGEESTVALLADSDKHILAEENTCFSIVAMGDEVEGKIAISLEYGTSLFTIDSKLNEGSEFEVNTPNASLSVRGTTFSVNYDVPTNTTVLEVQEGIVEAVAESETRSVKAGEKAVITEGEFSDTVGSIDEIIYYSENEKTKTLESVSNEVIATLEKVPNSTITYVAVGGHGKPGGMGVPFQYYVVGVSANPYEGYQYVRSESETIEFNEYTYSENLGYEVPWFNVPESGNHIIYVYYEPINNDETIVGIEENVEENTETVEIVPPREEELVGAVINKVDIIYREEAEKIKGMESVDNATIESLEKVPDSSIFYVAVGGHGNPQGTGVHFQQYVVGTNPNPNEGYRYVRCESDTIEFSKFTYIEQYGCEVPSFNLPESGNHYIYFYYEPIE